MLFRLTLLLVLLSVCSGCALPPGQLSADSGDDGVLPEVDAAAPDAVPAALPRLHGSLKPGHYVVLTQDDLAEAAHELAAYRRARGYTTRVFRVSDLVSGPVAPRTLVAALRSRLAPLAGQQPVHLVLLGDAPGANEATDGQIPALPCENHYGGCWTDVPYADLDGDGLPDVALGRIPARSVEQARAYLARLQAHEGSYTPGPWNRRVSLYTGEGGFGSATDALIELGMMEGLKRVDHAFDIVGAYNSPQSGYYYTPFSDKVVDLFNEGSLFVFYVGHGLSSWTSGLTSTELEAIHCTRRAPGVFLIACLTGDYVGPQDSLAEALLAKDDGAITAVAASDISHPYGNGVLLYELNRVLLGQRPATYGEALRQAKQAMLQHDDEFRQLLDSVAVVQVPPAEQPILRAEHVNLYNLLGDPAAAIMYPRSVVTLDPVTGSFKDGRLTVSGATPGIDRGLARVTLEVERDVMLHPLEPVDPYNPDEATVQANWARAVDKVVTEQAVPVVGGTFAAELRWTPPLPGEAFYVKVYAQDAAADSFGVVRVK